MSMAKQGAKTATPRLRFPEFRGAEGWPVSLLGSTATFEKGRGVSKAEVDPNGERFCIRYGELYTRYGEVIRQVFSKTNAAESTLFFSRKNDVIVPASGETKEDIATASCVLRDGIALGGDLNVIRSPHNGVFLSYLLNGSKRRELAKVAQGDTVVHLYPRQLALLPVALPEPSEQKKIADCLTSLDEVIAAQGRKVEALKTHKRGLMQQLFPREGKTRPRLRFPEFRDAPEWKPAILADVCRPQQWQTISSSELTKDGYAVYGANGLIGRYPSFNHEFETVAVTCRGSTCGEVLLIPPKSYITGNSMCLDEIDPAKHSHHFIFHLLRHRGLRDVISGSAQPQIVGQAIRKLKISLPNLLEQQRIADCLSSLDTQIAAESRQLVALKTHKQGLMQQLFPAPEAAGA